MTQSQLLYVEIRTLEPSALSPEQLPTLTIFVDSNSNYNFATGVEEIKTAIGFATARSAIANMIPHLDTDCRYPLMFRVQILPGSKVDAFLFSLAHYNHLGKKRKRRGTC